MHTAAVSALSSSSFRDLTISGEALEQYQRRSLGAIQEAIKTPGIEAFADPKFLKIIRDAGSVQGLASSLNLAPTILTRIGRFNIDFRELHEGIFGPDSSLKVDLAALFEELHKLSPQGAAMAQKSPGFSALVMMQLALKGTLCSSLNRDAAAIALHSVLDSLNVQVHQSVGELLFKVAEIVVDTTKAVIHERLLGSIGRLCARSMAIERLLHQKHLPTGAPPELKLPYYDIASGFNFLMYLPTLNPEVQYTCIDPHPFVAAVLRDTSDIFERTNLKVISKPVSEVSLKPESCGAIRLKHVYSYIPNYYCEFQRYELAIAPGGALIFQSDPIRSSRVDFVASHAELVGALIDKGWRLTFSVPERPRDLGDYDWLRVEKPSHSERRHSQQEKQKLRQYFKALERMPVLAEFPF